MLKNEEQFEKLSYPEAPKVVTEIPGPKAKPILEKELANETPTRIGALGMQMVWSEALGATVKDPDGNIYIDLTSGVAVNAVGHSHPKIVEVIRKECGVLMHAPDMSTPYRQKLGEKLSEIAPGNLKGNVRMAYGLSGSSAVEIAIKFLRGATGKSRILAFQGAYHGALGLTLSLTTSPVFRSKYRPFTPFIERLGPYPYCYRCAIHLTYPKCELECAKYVEYQLTDPYSGVDVKDVAALIVEPMQGEGGYVPTPPGWLDYIRKLCTKLDILLIDDEVQMGMGRTGKMFCIEHYGVEPDAITMGKALGGDFPFSGVMFKKDIVKDLEPFSHVLTAVGNSTGCAVACTNIDLLRDGLVDRGLELGNYTQAKLKEMAKERELIGDVRGLGMAIAIEIVSNRETKEPVSPEVMGRILWTLRDKGVVILPCGRYGNVLRFMPPLVITKKHVDKALEIISEVLKEVEDDVLKG
jgi:4-aminobutyrate aminotransferase